MKISIALTLVITIAVFSFVSGYSIGTHNKLNTSHKIARSRTNVLSSGTGTATAAEHFSAASGGYGVQSNEVSSASSPPSPGYGQ